MVYENTSRVLIVDDDPSARAFFERLLKLEGYSTTIAANGEEASAILDHDTFDVILSDISMPEMNGIGLLKSVRNRDIELPMVLVTGDPSVDTAVEAVHHGALRYLRKPVDSMALLDAVRDAVSQSSKARAQKRALEQMDDAAHVDREQLEVDFDEALGGLWVAFQPIVSPATQRVEAFEALMRSSATKLNNPGRILKAAEHLGRIQDLGRRVRAQVATVIAASGRDEDFYVNLHPQEVADDFLYSTAAPLHRFSSRVVFEITERSRLQDVGNFEKRIEQLRGMGYRVALDDLGSGYSGLNSFVQLKPDVVKLDMTLVQGVAQTPTKQKLVRTVMELCTDLKTPVVAEGVETLADVKALMNMRVDLLQGYYFARPEAALASAVVDMKDAAVVDDDPGPVEDDDT